MSCLFLFRRGCAVHMDRRTYEAIYIAREQVLVQTCRCFCQVCSRAFAMNTMSLRCQQLYPMHAMFSVCNSLCERIITQQTSCESDSKLVTVKLGRLSTPLEPRLLVSKWKHENEFKQRYLHLYTGKKVK